MFLGLPDPVLLVRGMDPDPSGSGYIRVGNVMGVICITFVQEMGAPRSLVSCFTVGWTLQLRGRDPGLPVEQPAAGDPAVSAG
jgi:hypothetical protein